MGGIIRGSGWMGRYMGLGSIYGLMGVCMKVSGRRERLMGKEGSFMKI
jgi:hypothetical protein